LITPGVAMFLTSGGEPDRRGGANGREVCLYFYLPDFSIGQWSWLMRRGWNEILHCWEKQFLRLPYESTETQMWKN